MTNEDINEAINYLKSYRKLDENLHNTSPKDSVAYFATDKCLKYWDMAIKALEQYRMLQEIRQEITNEAYTKQCFDSDMYDYEDKAIDLDDVYAIIDDHIKQIEGSVVG